MSKGNNTGLYIGLAAAGGLFLFMNKGTAAPGTSILSTGGSYPYLILPGHPAVPSAWNYQYYLQWIYPAMIAANPNVANPNYQLSQAELNQYLQNYSDLRGWLPTAVPHLFPNQNAALQFHWAHSGPTESRTFLPFLPTTTAPYTPPPANPNSSGGTPWYTTALSVAGSLIALAGRDDFQDAIQSTELLAAPRLNDWECEVLISGSAIGLEILPFYYGLPGGRALEAEDRIKAAVYQYTR